MGFQGNSINLNAFYFNDNYVCSSLIFTYCATASYIPLLCDRELHPSTVRPRATYLYCATPNNKPAASAHIQLIQSYKPPVSN
jgi:hypothetical protein